MVLEIVHVFTLQQLITVEEEQHSVIRIGVPITGFRQIGDQLERAVNRGAIFGLVGLVDLLDRDFHRLLAKLAILLILFIKVEIVAVAAPRVATLVFDVQPIMRVLIVHILRKVVTTDDLGTRNLHIDQL